MKLSRPSWEALLTVPLIAVAAYVLARFFSGPASTTVAAVAVVAWFYGLRPAIAAAVLGFVILVLFALDSAGPGAPLGVVLHKLQARAWTYAIFSTAIIWSIERMRTTRARATQLHERMVSVLETMQDSFLLVDHTGAILYANSAACAQRGCDPAALTGKSVWEADSIARDTPVGEAFRTALEKHQPSHFEMEAAQENWWMYDVAPSPEGAFLFGRDITARKRTDQALRETESQLRVITDSLPGMIGHADAEHRYRFVNRVYSEWLKVDREELLGQTLEEVHRADWEVWGPHLERVARGEPDEFEWQACGLGGPARHFRTMLVPDLDPQGKYCGVFALSTDITERKRAEAAAQKSAALLRDSERRFRALFDQAAVGIAELDLNGRLLQVNPKYAHLFGFAPQELRQMTFIDLSPPEDRLNEALQFGRLAAGEFEQYGGERRRVRKDGSVVWVNLAAAVVRGDDGRPAGVVAVVEEITDRKTLEQELAQYTVEVTRSNRELEQFAYAASHDLREPLRTVTAYLQLIERRFADQDDQDLRGHFQIVHDAAGRMQELITALLTYSRIGQKNSRPLAPVSLDAVTDWVKMNLAQEIAASGAEIACEPLPQVLGDDTQLVQVLQNLFSNAIKYRAAGGAAPRIRVWSEERAKEWVISVRDNGAGIEPQYHEKIFGAFERLHGREVAGTGLGLAICRKIVERHGGRIWVESKPGEGSTFRFTLPM